MSRARMLVVVTLVAIGTLSQTATQAAIISTTLTPSDSRVVSDDTTMTTLGTVNTGFATTYTARSRADTSQDIQQVQSFIQFDLSGLTSAVVNNPTFSAEFRIDYADRANSINNLAVGLGQNISGAWDSGGSNNPLHDWGFDDESNSLTATPIGTLVGSVLGTDPPVNDLTLDVTSVVADWVNGVDPNWGFVLHYDRNAFQAAGFNNAELILSVSVPEPGTLALALLGLPLIRRRRRVR